MSITTPFFRCVRPGRDGHYSEGGRWMYVTHPNYAPDAVHYLRAFEVLQQDFQRLLEYIEPADENESTYSFRCMEILLRACGEFEANCKAILGANGYVKKNELKVPDYRKLERTHHLSEYVVRLPVWRGLRAERRPFDRWQSPGGFVWYQDHHGAKHNRHIEFPKASFGNVVDAISAVVALLASQFYTYDFRPQGLGTSIGQPADGFELAIGDYFHVKFPVNWNADDRYAFDWQAVKSDPNPFQVLTF